MSKTNTDEGLVTAWSIGPRPLDPQEWEEVEKLDSQLMKEIITREIGPGMATLFYLAPEKYKLIFVAALKETRQGTGVPFTAKMTKIEPIPGTYWPESPPPTAARLGLIKIWTAFEKELAADGFSNARIDRAKDAKKKEKGV